MFVITSEALWYGTCSQGISHFTCTVHTHTFIRNRNEPTCVCLPIWYCTRLPIPEGWKGELAWVAGYVVRQFTPARRQSPTPLLTGLNVMIKVKCAILLLEFRPGAHLTS